MNLTRREFVQLIGVGVANGLFSSKVLGKGQINRTSIEHAIRALYDVPLNGNARILHITDTHAQLLPTYFREPNVNLGFGNAFGKLPHIVGQNLSTHLGLDNNPLLQHAFTYLDYEESAHNFGKVGGFSYIKTLLDNLREAAGGVQNTITVDGGDLWQGSATALWTRGRDMVDASNLLGVDAMTGHWEFTYSEREVLSNIKAFNGEFLGQNVAIKEESLFEDAYAEMVSEYGYGLYDEDNSLAFKPYTLKIINGYKVAIIGQAFPRTGNANPQSNFPDWSFGLREDELKVLVSEIRTIEKPSAVIMLSHNGMDVDLKMASRVSGIDVILGGHTHDGMSKPIKVKNASGETWVTNAGCHGKYVGVLDMQLSKSGIKSMQYKLLPVFARFIDADETMVNYLHSLYQRKYDANIIESRRKNALYSPNKVGKRYEDILNEKLTIAEQTLYRRGNLIGTWDQVIVDALRHEHDTQIALSPGVRWGGSLLEGDIITMRNVFEQTAITYGETYRSEITGEQLHLVLEGVAENLFVTDPYAQSGGDMVRVGGLNFTIDPIESYGNRISEVRLDDGTVIKNNKTYSVSGWAQVNEIGEGRLIWDVVADFLRSKKTLNLSKVNYPNIKNVRKNPGIADYQGIIQ